MRLELAIILAIFIHNIQTDADLRPNDWSESWEPEFEEDNVKDPVKVDKTEDDKLQKWLVTKPNLIFPPILPMAGLNGPEPGGDVSLMIETDDILHSYRCYSCEYCGSLDVSKATVEGGCTECVDAIQKWLVKKPITDIPPVEPIIYELYSDNEGNLLSVIKEKNDLPSFHCYVCDNCHVSELNAKKVEKGCTECVIYLKSSTFSDRLCNRKSETLCRSNFKARCCQGDLCNRARPASLSFHSAILTLACTLINVALKYIIM
ncbi:unnamed protein product [Echinostoma caproni]|uniref:Uncharacterized protein n=1 Tax=Echinostoma caproni TaxID=27848 RepID=A0A183AKX1_9TREM|nr:unnamed protein product [Echinostoma caproni]